MGEFMIYFPITLSVVLGSSLIVAIFFNSMLVSQFMEIKDREITNKSLWRLTIILGSLELFYYLEIKISAFWKSNATYTNIILDVQTFY